MSRFQARSKKTKNGQKNKQIILKSILATIRRYSNRQLLFFVLCFFRNDNYLNRYCLFGANYVFGIITLGCYIIVITYHNMDFRGAAPVSTFHLSRICFRTCHVTPTNSSSLLSLLPFSFPQSISHDLICKLVQACACKFFCENKRYLSKANAKRDNIARQEELGLETSNYLIPKHRISHRMHVMIHCV